MDINLSDEDAELQRAHETSVSVAMLTSAVLTFRRVRYLGKGRAYEWGEEAY